MPELTTRRVLGDGAARGRQGQRADRVGTGAPCSIKPEGGERAAGR